MDVDRAFVRINMRYLLTINIKGDKMLNKYDLPDGIHDISNEHYHGASANSRSQLNDYKRCPYYFWYRHENPDFEKEAASKAMTTGTLLHVLTLEPEKYRKEFIEAPKVDRRTKIGKEIYKDFLVEAEGKIIVTNEQYETACAMSDNLRREPLIRKLLDNCAIEKSIFFTHQETGLQCKVRPDAWSKTIITDVKTTDSANYNAFQRSAYKYGYFLQAGMMSYALKSLGSKLDKFVIAAVENKAPFATCCYVLEEEQLEFGEMQFQTLMKKLKHSFDNNDWPMYKTRVLEVPNYAYYDYDNEEI